MKDIDSFSIEAGDSRVLLVKFFIVGIDPSRISNSSSMVLPSGRVRDLLVSRILLAITNLNKILTRGIADLEPRRTTMNAVEVCRKSFFFYRPQPQGLSSAQFASVPG